MKRTIVQSEKGLLRMLETLDRYPEFATDTEFKPGPRHTKRPLIGWAFAVHAGGQYESWYVPLGHDGPPQKSLFGDQVFKNVSQKLFLSKVKRLLQSKKHLKVCHSAETESEVASFHGIEMGVSLRDTMIEAWLYEEEKLYPFRLKELSKTILGVPIQKITDVTGSRSHKSTDTRGAEKYDLSPVPIEDAAVYVTDDTISTLRLHEWFTPGLKAEGVWNDYLHIEIPYIGVLRDLGLEGLVIDRPLLESQLRAVTHRIAVLEKSAFAEAGEVFNLRSRQQLGRILFEKLGLPECEIVDPYDREEKRLIPYRTPTGQYKTDDKVMGFLEAKGYKIGGLLREHGDLEKIRGTYLQGVLDGLVNRVFSHPALWQCATVTGRLGGDWQQTPRKYREFSLPDPQTKKKVRVSIRELVTCLEDEWLIVGDHGQLELRVFAHYSEDPVLMGAFARKEDIHTATQNLIMEAGVPKFERDEAKTVNFSVVYGINESKMIAQFGPEAGPKVYRALSERFASAMGYRDAVIYQAHLDQYIRTITGRKRRLPEINSDFFQSRSYAEREAFNAKIQGTAADLVKAGQIAAKRRVPEARQVLQVHDEVLHRFKGTKQQALECAMELKSAYEGVAKLSVPLVFEPKIARNWRDAKG